MNGVMLDIGWGALTRHTPIEVLLTLPDGDEKKVYKLAGEVARVSDVGTAVRFQAMEPKVMYVLSRFLGSG
jgi:hypothetical protein